MLQRPKSTPHLFFVHSQRRLLAFKRCKFWNRKFSGFVSDLCSFLSNFYYMWWLAENGLIAELKIKGCRPLVCFICVLWIFLVIQLIRFGSNHHSHLSAWLCSSHLSILLFPSQPIVDLSPIKRSASSVTQQHRQEVGLKEYDLERPELAQPSTGPGHVQGQDRAHHHHHHHRCHRRRDKDKKQKSLERTTSVQPSSTVGEEKKLWRYMKYIKIVLM